MSEAKHYLIVDNRGYCGGCEYCGPVAEVAYCACGGDEDCPGIDSNLSDLGQLIETLAEITGKP